MQICYPKNVNSVTAAGPNCRTESVNVAHIKCFSVLFWIVFRLVFFLFFFGGGRGGGVSDSGFRSLFLEEDTFLTYSSQYMGHDTECYSPCVCKMGMKM